MFVHGLKDNRISSEYGKRVMRNTKSATKVWYPIPNAGHNDLMSIGGDKYLKRITSFFLANLK